ncbi:Heterogeneous nuclear ribonucleoprotein 1 [Camellia lanceoleosa]|uniref:Heterogeneous nuclear ribonucleoprotein 1 n=1 Tax=Camellia lanceoleosa TaxID=1840588 RepID=A0ACC0GAD5_9ERIC|nr:Heterogeneous nuclear ribonucleoprotein 1 [Camellia lanceoleosa]
MNIRHCVLAELLRTDTAHRWVYGSLLVDESGSTCVAFCRCLVVVCCHLDVVLAVFPLGKLFIGGISWDTNEDRLKEYFSGCGEVLEAVIMKDRSTGRTCGFGFVVFADPVVVERVIKEKHNIDGKIAI